jgi:hypothetical protein
LLLTQTRFGNLPWFCRRAGYPELMPDAPLLLAAGLSILFLIAVTAVALSSLVTVVARSLLRLHRSGRPCRRCLRGNRIIDH